MIDTIIYFEMCGFEFCLVVVVRVKLVSLLIC